MTTIIIVNKSGALKELNVKEFNENDLYKKCGFKNNNSFGKYAEWIVNIKNKKYNVKVYGKNEGKANNENKYDFPPPIDNTLFFGSCAIVCECVDKTFKFSISLWDKIYEKLFGGFEDLNTTYKEDEEEIDELTNIPNKDKTKNGYLKDGFVVSDIDDSNDEDNDNDTIEYLSTSNGSELESDNDTIDDESSSICNYSELEEEEYEPDDNA